MNNLKIILKENINKEEYEEIKELEKLCVETDNISFKLELEYKFNHSKINDSNKVNINEFMFYSDDLLIGYIGIGDFGGDALEINGMVHPDYRQRGIFTKLYSLVIDEWKKRKQQEILLLCDNKSAFGINFINKVCDTYDHSEYDMELNMDSIPNLKQNNINLKKAMMTDSIMVAKMDSVFFDMDVKEDDEYIIENIENGTTYIAVTMNEEIGKVRLELIEGVGGIYGLGIMPDLRGKGYGRELLLNSIHKLIEMGAKKIILQVETNNKNALNLYKSCGFIENYRMDYYKLSK